MFCAADVCKALGYANPRKAVTDHVDEGDVTKRDTPTSSGVQTMSFVNESGLYSLIFGSKLQVAKAFKKWVTSEVLPSIRKSGGYIAAKQDESPEVIMARALQIANETIERSKQQLQMLEGENANLQEQNRILAPKAQYTDEVLQSNSTYTLTQVAHDLGMRSVHSLISELTRLRILFKQSGQYQPTAKVAQKGYFKTRTAKYIKPDGSIGTSLSTVVTERGRVYLHSVFSK